MFEVHIPRNFSAAYRLSTRTPTQEAGSCLVRLLDRKPGEQREPTERPGRAPFVWCSLFMFNAVTRPRKEEPVLLATLCRPFFPTSIIYLTSLSLIKARSPDTDETPLFVSWGVQLSYQLGRTGRTGWVLSTMRRAARWSSKAGASWAATLAGEQIIAVEDVSAKALVFFARKYHCDSNLGAQGSARDCC